jgi:hypothetical protein
MELKRPVYGIEKSANHGQKTEDECVEHLALPWLEHVKASD